MSNAMKAAIAVLSLVLVGVLVVIYVLVQDDGPDEAVPTPTVTQEPSQAPTAETPTETATDPDSASPTQQPGDPDTSSTVTGEPSVSGSPSSEASASVAPSGYGDEQTFLWEGKATFDSFTVELLPDDEATRPEPIEGKTGTEVEVCVLQQVGDSDDGLTRISQEPWRFESDTGEVLRPVENVYQPGFPTEDQLAEGDCVRGWLTFDEFQDQDLSYTQLVYENGLGDQAIWSFH